MRSLWSNPVNGFECRSWITPILIFIWLLIVSSLADRVNFLGLLLFIYGVGVASFLFAILVVHCWRACFLLLFVLRVILLTVLSISRSKIRWPTGFLPLGFGTLSRHSSRLPNWDCPKCLSDVMAWLPTRVLASLCSSSTLM